MRILVQNAETGLFYRDAGQWVADKNEARMFTNSTEALDICLHQERGKAQILFSFQNPEFDMVINPSERTNSQQS